MNYQEAEEKYISYFKKEYQEFIDELLREVKQEKNIIDYSKYTSKTVEKSKEMTSEFLKIEKIKDHTFTDNISFSLNYSFYLEFISHNDRINLDSQLFNVITKQNRINYK